MLRPAVPLPMPTRLPATRIVRRCLGVWLGLCLAHGGVLAQQQPGQAQQAMPAAQAASAPTEGSTADAILQLLQQKGLMAAAAMEAAGAEAQPRLRQVRDAASDMVLSAMHFLGVPYRRGGNSASSGFDCSGFTRHVFENSIGLVLPRRADEQAKDSKLRQVLRDELKPGDLVFFNTMRRAFSHVGIYVGDGKFIHSPSAGGKVRIEDMRQAYWSQRFNGARRPDLPAATAPQPAAATTPAPLATATATTTPSGLLQGAPAATPLGMPAAHTSRSP